MSVRVVLITLIAVKRSSPFWAAVVPGSGSQTIRTQEVNMIQCRYDVIRCLKFCCLDFLAMFVAWKLKLK